MSANVIIVLRVAESKLVLLGVCRGEWVLCFKERNVTTQGVGLREDPIHESLSLHFTT